MKLLSLAALAGVTLTLAGCIGSLVPGGRAGAYKPDSVMSTQFTGDVSSAKVGEGVTYVMEAGGSKTTMTTAVVGQEGELVLVEQWTDSGSMAYGYLLALKGKKIEKAWAAAKDDKEWTAIKVTEPPAAQPTENADAPKPKIKESKESRKTAAGDFASQRIDTTVTVQGKDYASTAWFSKDAPKLYAGSEKGGMVASEASGSKTELSAVTKDAKPTIPLPAMK